jgi:PAS domain S-box-containing protein
VSDSPVSSPSPAPSPEEASPLISEWRFGQELFEAVDMGILVGDAEARVIHWNQRARDMLGLTDAFLATHPNHSEVVRVMLEAGVYEESDVAYSEAMMKAWMDKPAESRGTLVYERTVGTGMVLELRTSFLPSGGFVRTLTDITERKRAEDRLARQGALLDTTLDAMIQGIILVDPDRRIVLHNRRYLDLLRLPGHLFDKGAPLISDIVAHQAERGDFGSELERLPGDMRDPISRGDPFTRTTYERDMADGRVIAVDTHDLPDGSLVRTFTDITESRRANHDLRVAKEAAEDALIRLTAAQETLVVAEKMASLGQLVAGIAHEINTPLGTGLTAASLLAEKTEDLSKALATKDLRRSQLTDYLEVAQDCSGFILSNLTRAAELIQSFKQVAVDQTSDLRRDFDLRTTLDEILLSLRPRLKRGPHVIALDCPEGIAMDTRPGALVRVVTNLVVNALVHGLGEGPDDPPGSMTLAVMVDGPDHVTMTFSDTGRGIPRENLGRIFDPFFTTRRGEGGTGLGLNIVYNLVSQTLEGTITVNSVVGRGTTFTIRLPRVLSGSDDR